jgi:hypothetical protein
MMVGRISGGVFDLLGPPKIKAMRMNGSGMTEQSKSGK